MLAGGGSQKPWLSRALEQRTGPLETQFGDQFARPSAPINLNTLVGQSGSVKGQVANRRPSLALIRPTNRRSRPAYPTLALQ